MDKQKLVEAVETMKNWAENLEKYSNSTNEHLRAYLESAAAMTEIISPKAKIFIPILKLAVKLLASNAAQIFDLMKRINQLLEEDICPPAAPKQGGNGNGTQKN
ncbi:MAG: hypothetical protein AAB731_04565 [Patescibacteria group bacterium]